MTGREIRPRRLQYDDPHRCVGHRARKGIVQSVEERQVLGVAGFGTIEDHSRDPVFRAFFEDQRFPYFRNALQPFDKATIDNPDAIYFAARIDGREPTVIRGRAEDFRHWRGQSRAASGRLAPQYLIFEVTSGDLTGDSGSLAELAPGVKARTGWIDCTQLEVEKDGSFEILLAPERPAGHTGNFIPTRIVTGKPGPEGSRERFASYVSGRQLFYDWDREDAVQLGIVQLATVGQQPPVLDPATAARNLRRAGSIVRGQMHFWNEFYAILLETYGKRYGSDGPRFMPRNAFNQPNAASGATGGGQSTNIYAGGVFELEPDEALVIESRIPTPPQYIGFHLGNLWGESLDFANRHTSLNGFQVEPDPDGVLRYVVALSISGAIATSLGWQHPYWAMVASVVVLSGPDLASRLVRGLQRVLGTLLGVGVAAAVLAWAPHQGVGAVLVIAALQVLAELFVGRNYALALLFITPLALMMGQLVAPSPAGPLLRDRLLETVLGAFVAMAVLLLVPDRLPRRRRAAGGPPT